MRRALLSCLAIAFALACGDDITEPIPTKPTAVSARPLFATTTTQDGLSISTDKDDYHPGDTVYFTGFGWQPGDILDIVLTDDPLTHDPHTWTVDVKEDGTFHDSTYVVDEGDINVKFTLVATSRATGRNLTVQFTDAELLTAELTAPNNDVTITQGSTANFTISLTASGAIKCSATPSSPSTAKVHTLFSISAGGAVSSSTLSNALNFFGGAAAGGPNNCDITWTGAPTAYTVAASVSAAATTPVGDYTITLRSTAGNVVLTNPSGQGGSLGDDIATDITVHVKAPVDETRPAVTIEQAAAQADPTSASPINFTVVFSETVSDFADADVSLSGTAGATTASVTGGGATYNVAVSGMTTDGTVIASIAANVAHDAAQNGNVVSASTDNTVTFVAPAAKLAFTTPAKTGAVGQCLGPITTQTQSASGTPRDVTSNVAVNLATDGAGAFFSNNACSSGITTVEIPSGSSSASFYYKATSRGDGSHDLTASADGLASATQTQTINKADQTISFTSTAPTNAVYNGTYVVSATASSGLAVSFSSLTASVCTVNGSVSFVGVGTCTIAADQAGNDDYNAAPQVTQTFQVAKAPATISLSNLSHIYNGSQKSATATTSPVGLTVVTITYNGSATAPTEAGSYTVLASLDNLFYEAPDATGTLVIDKAPQTITFTSTAPTSAVIGGSYTVSATASSGLAVTFSSLSSSVCTVSASTVSFVAVGDCTVAADQAGNANYHAAPQVSQTFKIKYVFSGFSAPVDWPTTVNMAKAGQAIPLKWQLKDAGGNPVSTLTAVKVSVKDLACVATNTDQVEEYSSGDVGLQNLGGGYYQFNWKTPTGYASSCKSIGLDLGEGVVRLDLARFTFKK